MSKKSVDWIAIETEYRGTTTAVLQIAKAHGVNEGTIRSRAKKNGWIRDNGKLKRSLVESKLDGITNSSTNSEIRELIEEGAERDAQDMRDGLAVARLCIARLAMMVADAEDAREIKTIVEANRGAIETIRTIRGLSDTKLEDLGRAIGEGAALSASEAYKRMLGGD